MNTQDILYSIFIILIFIISITYLIYYSIKKSKINKYVLDNSKKIKKLIELNDKYSFKKIIKNNRYIKFSANSKRNCETLSYGSVALYYMENNFDYLRDDVENMIYNKTKYKEYIEEVEKIKKLHFDISSESYISESVFELAENRLFEKKVIKDNSDLNVKIEIYYISPKGRNYYNKIGSLSFINLSALYCNWKANEEYKKSAEFERSKMSNFLRYDVLKRDNFRCKICGASADEGVKLHVDHIIPVSKGGKTEMDNLQTLCDKCNLGKSNKI